MKNILNRFYLLLFISFITVNCNSDDEQSPNANIAPTPTTISVDYLASTATIDIVATQEWSVYSNEAWITCTPSSSINLSQTVAVAVADNPNTSEREGTIVFKSGTSRSVVTVTQAAKPTDATESEITPPDGYQLVWNDEFNEGVEPSSLWSFQTGGGGWGNNELQTYVAGSQGSEQLAAVKDGVLSITAKKIGDIVYSIRMNSIQSWKYGYFEARLQLPTGKGTWPAFWMMPKNFTSWPGDGEIDIMEEVGYRPNYVSSAIHCSSYNHLNNTEKTNETFLSTAQTEFHIYALEWTEDYIRTYVDGKELFYFENDKTGNKNTWPFNTPFYIILNLAWGGNWGGAQGVDEAALPAVYEVDYVRVFQKK